MSRGDSVLPFDTLDLYQFSMDDPVTGNSVTGVGTFSGADSRTFAGAGGMSLGLQRAGFEVIQAYDSWKTAVDIYRQNIGPHAWQVDLKDIFKVGPMLVALAPDIICGGPPCQDFSSAGERVEGERAALTRAFAMLVCIARPKWFLMENVPQAAGSKAWADAREMLVRTGYGLTEAKLDASFYGVPQARKRLFVIGRLGEADGFLESALAAARSPRPMTVRDLLGDSLGDAFYMHPRMPGKRGIWSANDPAPTVRGSSRRPIPEGYRPHPADAAVLERGYIYARPLRAGRGVRTLDEPYTTITRSSFEGLHERYIENPHPKDPVPAASAAVPTREQIARIQGFPASWDWTCPHIRAVEQMVANAVPPPLAEAIGRVMLAREAGESIPEIQGRFGQWLHQQRGFSKAAVRNAKSRLNRARRILGGRTFADATVELAALGAAEGFDSLPAGTRSDLRVALRLYREWLAEPKAQRKTKASAVALAA